MRYETINSNTKKMHLIEEWIMRLGASGLKENTVLAYSRDVRSIRSRLNGVELDAATPDQFRFAFKILRLERLSQTSLNRMHFAIQNFLYFLKELNFPYATEPGVNLLPVLTPSQSHMIGHQTKRIFSPQPYKPYKYAMLADSAYLRERYLTRRMGTEEIATEVGCTKQAVFKELRAHGIETRSHSQAWRAAAEKEHTMNAANPINEDFFSDWSPAAAYVLGVIHTDGNLHLSKAPDGSERCSGRVTISQKEPELLIKVAALMGHSGKMTFQPRREYRGQVAGEIYTLGFSSDRMLADLMRLGLRPRKSLSLQFPDMPEEHRRHFIRGCWDGDGSVYIDKQSQWINASFISGSLNLVEGISEVLKNAGLPERKIYVRKAKNPCYYIRVTGTQVPKLYHYLYDDVPESQYLDRKHKLFRLSLQGKTDSSG